MKLLRLTLLLSLPATISMANPLVPSETEDFGDLTTKTMSNDRPSGTYIDHGTPEVETHTYYGYTDIGFDTQSAPDVDDLGDLTQQPTEPVRSRGTVVEYSTQPDTRGAVPVLDYAPSAPVIETPCAPRKPTALKAGAAVKATSKTQPAKKAHVKAPKVSTVTTTTKKVVSVTPASAKKTTTPASKLDRVLNKLNKAGFSIARSFDSFLDRAFGIKI